MRRCMSCGRYIRRMNYVDCECHAYRGAVRMKDWDGHCFLYVDIRQHPQPIVVQTCKVAIRRHPDTAIESIVSDVLYWHKISGASAPRMVQTYVEAINGVKVKEEA